MDERYAAIDVLGKGVVIFSASVGPLHSFRDRYRHCLYRCSHAGIVNVVSDVVSKFRRPIYMVFS
jgi:7,8-dihydropterin-6-yl-methyl-4-(beta-D-ribofuranosyl)aminobenzene 5'-phosphate synthase